MKKSLIFFSFIHYFFLFISVKSQIITQQKLIKAGDSIIMECLDTCAKWTLKSVSIASCTKAKDQNKFCNCKSERNNIHAAGNKTTSVLHFNPIKIEDKGTLKCNDNIESFNLFVGSKYVYFIFL